MSCSIGQCILLVSGYPQIKYHTSQEDNRTSCPSTVLLYPQRTKQVTLKDSLSLLCTSRATGRPVSSKARTGMTGGNGDSALWVLFITLVDLVLGSLHLGTEKIIKEMVVSPYSHRKHFPNIIHSANILSKQSQQRKANILLKHGQK